MANILKETSATEEKEKQLLCEDTENEQADVDRTILFYNNLQLWWQSSIACSELNLTSPLVSGKCWALLIRKHLKSSLTFPTEGALTPIMKIFCLPKTLLTASISKLVKLRWHKSCTYTLICHLGYSLEFAHKSSYVAFRTDTIMLNRAPCKTQKHTALRPECQNASVLFWPQRAFFCARWHWELLRRAKCLRSARQTFPALFSIGTDSSGLSAASCSPLSCCQTGPEDGRNADVVF